MSGFVMSEITRLMVILSSTFSVTIPIDFIGNAETVEVAEPSVNPQR